MAKVTRAAGALKISFTEQEGAEIGLFGAAEFDITKAKDGILLLTSVNATPGATSNAKATPAVIEEKELVATPAIPSVKPNVEAATKIYELLRTLPPRDKIEGWFEKKLDDTQKNEFAKMLANGEVTKYKSSEAFRKSLYTIPSRKERAGSRKLDNNEKAAHEYTLDKDGFMIVKNELNAKSLSEQLRERIKGGEIKGIRSFGGEFFVIENALLQDAEKKIVAELIKDGKQNSEQLSKKTSFTPTLVKIAAEFLKDEGQIMEKTKGAYMYIE